RPVCREPEGRTQETETNVPGRRSPMIAVSASGDVTGRPAARVMTSPGARPAAAAPVPHSTPWTSAPECTGAIAAGTPAAAEVWRQGAGVDGLAEGRFVRRECS